MVRTPEEVNAKFSPVFFSKRVYVLEARVELEVWERPCEWVRGRWGEGVEF